MVALNDNKPAIRISAMERGPGPARYLLPGSCGFRGHDFTKGKNPAFSFGLRSRNLFGSNSSPGPAQYKVETSRHGRCDMPSFSLHSRPKQLQFTETPGPNCYRPEKCHPPGKACAPSFSFGLRTRHHQKMTTPSPNAYTVPTTVGTDNITKRSAESYSMTGKCLKGSFHEDMSKTPGPGTYKTCDAGVTRNKCPSYSITGRSHIKTEAMVTPGPGRYKPEKVTIFKSKAPMFSFGIRHSDYLAPMVEQLI